jgi:hypothetical protein
MDMDGALSFLGENKRGLYFTHFSRFQVLLEMGAFGHCWLDIGFALLVTRNWVFGSACLPVCVFIGKDPLWPTVFY